MAYLIDSDIIIDLLANVPDVVTLVDRIRDDGVAISAISYMEAFQGIGRGLDPDADEVALGAIVARIPILPFSQAEARRCASLRETLRDQGRRVNSRALDLLIAATAIEHELILVTRNLRDYRDVPGLSLYGSAQGIGSLTPD